MGRRNPGVFNASARGEPAGRSHGAQALVAVDSTDQKFTGEILSSE